MKPPFRKYNRKYNRENWKRLPYERRPISAGGKDDQKQATTYQNHKKKQKNLVSIVTKPAGHRQKKIKKYHKNSFTQNKEYNLIASSKTIF